MNKFLINLLVLTILFGCNAKSKTQIVVSYEQKVNSKEFLIKHNLNTLKNKISLVSNKSYPKEILGQYMLFKTIEDNNSITEHKEKELFMLITNSGLAIRGIDQMNLILQINVVYLKHVTVLKCVNEFEFAPNIFLFDDGVLVISIEKVLAFLKKID